MGTNHTRSHQFAEVLFHFTIEKYCESTKNHFKHQISFRFVMFTHYDKKKSKAKNQTDKNRNSPSTNWHSSKGNMRKDVYDWIAYSSTQ